MCQSCDSTPTGLLYNQCRSRIENNETAASAVLLADSILQTEECENGAVLVEGSYANQRGYPRIECGKRHGCHVERILREVVACLPADVQ
jgi:hypothetical protein